jgi:hypothetical protein
MLKLSVIDPTDGMELREIPLKTEGMGEGDLFPILHSQDPRSAYERWLIGNKDDVQSYLQELDEKIAEAKKDYHVEWKRKAP